MDSSDTSSSRQHDGSRAQQHSKEGSRENGFDADMRQVANEASEAAKDRASRSSDSIKHKGGAHVAGISRAVRDAADRLGDELPQAARYIHSAADRLEDASAALRERSIEDLVSSFSSFARRQPAAAFAGSLLAGFALSRFLKSSTEHADRTSKRGRNAQESL